MIIGDGPRQSWSLKFAGSYPPDSMFLSTREQINLICFSREVIDEPLL